MTEHDVVIPNRTLDAFARSESASPSKKEDDGSVAFLFRVHGSAAIELDAWGLVYEVERSAGEEDHSYRKRILQTIILTYAG